jgi:hypothetical protein
VAERLLTDEERLLAALLDAFELDALLELLDARLEPPDCVCFPFFDLEFFFFFFFVVAADLSDSIEDAEPDTDELDEALELDRFGLLFLAPFFDVSSADVAFLLGLSLLLDFRSVLSEALGSELSTRRLASLPRLPKSSLDTPLLMYFSAS